MAIGVTEQQQPGQQVTDAIRVSVPDRGLRQDLRAINIVWRRELIRFKSDRLRAVTSLVQPVLFLFVLGTGLSSLASHGLPQGIDFKTFIYPGVLAMSVLFTAIFSAASIVWDREFGFLREMLVAPVSRSAIVIGKCLGGATVATFQGIVILALAGLAHVPYDPVLFLIVIGELLLLSFTLTRAVVGHRGVSGRAVPNRFAARATGRLCTGMALTRPWTSLVRATPRRVATRPGVSCSTGPAGQQRSSPGPTSLPWACCGQHTNSAFESRPTSHWSATTTPPSSRARPST